MAASVQEVKEIWCNVLGTEDIDMEQKFYDLGGNSIMLLIILDEVFQKYEKEISVADISQIDTVSKMTNYINEECQGE